MTSHFIWVLTNCGILKWKKRLTVENLVFNNEKYTSVFRNYKIKILVNELIFPVSYTMTVFINDKFKYSVENEYVKKLYHLLNSKDIKEKYIVPFSINYISNDLKRRSVKIHLLTKRLEVL